ncbi:MAG: copper resistance protein B [Pseudomonadota bacterium]
MKPRRHALIAYALLCTTPALAADDNTFTFVQADRLEQLLDEDETVWDVQGWIGDDLHKLWVKAEGEREDSTDESELQLLYSRAWTPFFDWQIGLRQDFQPESRTQLVVGLQGLAPQWFEIDSALFLSDEGDLSARVEVEYDVLLTQRLILQPRLEVEMSASDVPEFGIGSGLVQTEFGLRLRYEWHRKFAPYFGLNWTRFYGNTADIAVAAGGDDSDVSALLGVRLWY